MIREPIYHAAVAATDDTAGRAAVTYPAPHGVESIVLADGDVCDFGRGSGCKIRFAYAPIADPVVPRIAGRIHVTGGRVFVEAASEPGSAGLEIRADDLPNRIIGIGEGYAPAVSNFRICVFGHSQAWVMRVATRRQLPQRADHNDMPTKRFSLKLTPMQRVVVDAYMAPLRRGSSEPATHKEVGAALSYHPNSAREALYQVWEKLFEAGVPMPDTKDKRVAVTEAMRLHRLLEPT